jgi:UDP-N-acetylmuramoyl-tripeptide--D-alanyl-D-alanine ligase
MASFTAEEVIAGASARQLAAGTSDFFGNISTDTRTIQKGDLFIPLTGENFNGHRFIPTAVEKGAAGVILSEDSAMEGIPDSVAVFRVNDTKQALEGLAHFHRMRFSVPVIAVTGSNGKTTTKDMIAAVLETRYHIVKTEKNHNNEIGMCQTLLRMTEDTEAVVVEMGMRGFGQIEELCRIAEPTIGVVTNVGTSHIGILGSRENIARAKSELIEALPEQGTAILNADDDLVWDMRHKMKGHVMSYGVRRPSDVRAENLSYLQDKTEYTVEIGGKTIRVSLPVLGIHNVYDSLAAISVGSLLSVEAEAMGEALSSYTPAAQRQHVVEIHGVRIMDDSYNANPLSMEMAFRSMQQLKAERRILVLGDMGELGDYADKLHEDTGAMAADMHFDALITAGPLGKAIARGARAHGMKDITECDTVEEAAEALRQKAEPGDLVLIKASHFMHMEKILDYLGGHAE